MRFSGLLAGGALALALICVAATHATPAIDPAQYGTPLDAGSTHPYPDYPERALHTLTNMARVSPRQFRDLYLLGYPGGGGIMNSYSAIPPVYWNRPLIYSSRFHAEDMAVNGCFDYNSCDGTNWYTRITGWYTEPGLLGEVIGMGPVTALDMLKDWLYANGAADGTPEAGNRALLLDSQLKEGGCGHAQAAGGGDHYWVQDLGAGAPDCATPLVAGAHFFEQGGQVAFRAIYYSSWAPQAAELEVEGEKYPMYLETGQALMGCYRADVPLATGCRRYRFVFRDGAGSERTYPGSGRLFTTQEGGCTQDYELPNSAVWSSGSPALAFRASPNPTRGTVTLEIGAVAAMSARVEVLDVSGRSVWRRVWALSPGMSRCVWDGCDATGRPVPAGVYLVRVDTPERRAETRRVVIVH